MTAASLTPCRVVTVIRLLSVAAGVPAVRSVRLIRFSLKWDSGSLGAKRLTTRGRQSAAKLSRAARYIRLSRG
ncbi:hypothetical protein Pth03_70050 [Planotetraspora thailandica]|uniref:Uncharacterized protein n=1 Tax=Planotetraspora thailandica TaxID=487172 RepID=A0A8J3Y0P2_9ACTN|nr:hypothetical protein Pth03_70050 [Planotetraspora thailandica]